MKYDWISRDLPRTPRTQSQVCIPGNGLPVCVRLSPAGPRNSSQSDAQDSWSECRPSCHLAKYHPKLPPLVWDIMKNTEYQHVTQRPTNHHRSFPPDRPFIYSVDSPVKPFTLRRLIFVIWVHSDLLAPEVDDLVEIESRHVHLTGEKDRAISCEGQWEQRSEDFCQAASDHDVRWQALPFLPTEKFSTTHSPFSSTISARSSMEGMV